MPENAPLPVSAMRIGRLNVSYLLSERHPSRAAVRSRLDSLLERQLPSACASLLGPLCPESDPSIWFIRRLDVNLAIDGSEEPAQLARAWSEPLARTLQRTLSNSDAREDVLRFPSPAAYLAQFLRDLADGVAWSKWYYVGFDGLRVLPLRVALCEALTREPVTGEGALLQMVGAGRLDKILRALNDGDCHTILRAFCGGNTNGEPAVLSNRHLETVWALAQGSPMLSREFTSTHREALLLYLAVRREVPTVQPTPALLDAILHSSARRDRAAVIEIRTEPLFTPFGGAFHLLPHLTEIDLDGCSAALPKFANAAPTALVRFLVLLKCLGRQRAPRAFFDPPLREIAGLPPDTNAGEIRAWAREVTLEMTRDFQARWAASCQRSGAMRGRWLCVRGARRGRLLIVTDGERNLWLRVVRAVDELSQSLQTIHQSIFTDHESPTCLLCDPALVSILPPTIARLSVLAWDSSEAAQHAAENSALATYLARARSLDEDLNYLNLSSLLRGTRDCDLALSLIANAILRSFASRLPGFACSSAQYLYCNFLDAGATIEGDEDRWIVNLKRPPHHIVLAMTGADQDVYHISWLNQRKVCLTTAES